MLANLLPNLVAAEGVLAEKGDDEMAIKGYSQAILLTEEIYCHQLFHEAIIVIYSLLQSLFSNINTAKPMFLFEK